MMHLATESGGVEGQWDDVENEGGSWGCPIVFSADIDNEGNGDSTVSHKASQVFPQCSISQGALPGLGRNDEQRVKQQQADQGMGYSSSINGRATGQQGGTGEDVGIEVRRVHIQHADVLRVNDLPKAREHCGYDDSLDAYPIHIDTQQD